MRFIHEANEYSSGGIFIPGVERCLGGDDLCMMTRRISVMLKEPHKNKAMFVIPK